MFQPLLISAGALSCSLLCYAMTVAIVVGLVERVLRGGRGAGHRTAARSELRQQSAGSSLQNREETGDWLDSPWLLCPPRWLLRLGS
jgi:hypothetical protein